MLINADQRGWVVATVAATAVAALGYGMYAATSPYGPSGGSWPGLAFGILGTLAMVSAGLLAARKKVRIRRLGSARVWMQAHVWLGLLAVPLILFHAGFRLGGALTTALMVLFTIVTVSGIVGLVLQQFVPVTMTTRVPLETVIGQIEHVNAGLATDAYELVASICGPLPEAREEQAALAAEEAVMQSRPANWKQIPRQRPAAEPTPESAPLEAFYLGTVRPYLRRDRRRATPAPDFHGLLAEAPPAWRDKVERVRQLCEESRQLAIQERLHGWLHNWLFVHAPLSFALFVLAAFHVVLALRY